MEQKTLGDRIKYHRKRLGLTQEQLAERMGVSAQAVSKWENNLSCPDISVLPELAEVFDVTLDELMGRASFGGIVREAEPLSEEEEKNFHWSWESPKKKLHSILFAVFVLLYGGLLLMNNTVPFDVSWWTLFWTLGLCFIGINGLCYGFSFFCLIMTLAGGFFLLDAYDAFAFKPGWGILIPAVLIIWGLSLLLDLILGKKKHKKTINVSHKGRTHRACSCENGYLKCEMNFGDFRSAVVTPLLRGGSIESNFGNYTIDFSACEAVAENCRIEVENNFGNLILLVPDHFKVEIGTKESFAGEVKITGSHAPVTRGQLTIDGESNFGPLEIKYI